MLDDILLFVKVVEAGSILSVEKCLISLNQPISRRIQTLEESLGILYLTERHMALL